MSVKMSDYGSLKATGKMILLELHEVASEEVTTASGIVMPGTAAKSKFENPNEIGVVVDLGPKYDGDLQIGDHVVIGTFVGAPVGVKGKKYLSLDSEKIFIKLYK